MGDLRLPADWEPHARCLMAWPGEESRPEAKAPQAIPDFAFIAQTIARFEPVLMLAYPEFARQAVDACGANVEVLELPFEHTWIRDSCPLFVLRGADDLVAVDFRFNRYGSKQAKHERYAKPGALLASRLGIPRLEVPYVLEGGSISTNGAGTLIAVESSILTESRNPGATREDLEAAFAEFLGIVHTIWLEKGLAEDETEGHADNVAIFTGPTRVLCQTVGDTRDPNYSRLAANRAALEATGLDVIELPVLPYSEHDGKQLARPYLNCFVSNGCVVAPLAGDPADAEGLAALGRAFPGREVVGVPGETLARGGGGVHCITQQLPVVGEHFSASPE